MMLFTGLKRKVGLKLPMITCALLLSTSSIVFAGKADVVGVDVVRSEADMFRFSVTVRHADAGWEHYADRWDVLDENGNVLGTRVLLHPHDTEQPFTRSTTLSLPMSVKKVTIRARDKKHGYGGKTITLSLPE